MTALNTAGSIFGNFPNTSSTQIFTKSGLCAAVSCTAATASVGVVGRYTWSGASGTGGAPSGASRPLHLGRGTDGKDSLTVQHEHAVLLGSAAGPIDDGRPFEDHHVGHCHWRNHEREHDEERLPHTVLRVCAADL